jgi:inosose dehydratase
MQTQVRPRVANAPLSYGAFEITVGTDFQVPDPVDVLGAIGGAGYVGTDLGPPGYLGEGETLQLRLAANQLDLVGGFVPVRFSEREHWEADLAGLAHTLELFKAAGATDARPVLCDAGGPERIANPGRGGEDESLRLDDRRWATLTEGVARATEQAREAGYEPVIHHHTSSNVEGQPEIERFLEDTEVGLLLDSGHLAVAGGDPIQGLKDWRERVGVVHLKDTRMDVLEQVREERADMISAWRRGLFCALGDGDVDLAGFCAELQAGGYDGWVVIEQDRVLEGNGAFAHAAQEQRGNREWLKEHAGW